MYKIAGMSVFYGLMRLAIENKDLTRMKGLINRVPINPEAWGLPKEYYVKYPERDAYGCFTDIGYEHLPDSLIFKDTIHTVYFKLRGIPEFEKERNLHKLYFRN